ncbi:chemotaxis response regulator protein-glutamate methylesterase [Vibrio sp. ZSDE26]|uniref:Protein-glutamate methylesterase/protein-glutamine glutaminase n=1 Tax=Vibrio amylolyticus TaxID=2847292 RepID=A0A9X1XLT5_9VIBR|nr:chemotaxis response regulator protein-glutamate methylesterase [Vibrio amylolyticus]MCK6264183.1 chemotaxis response regulator protein-glutamate methylesterase [Vibrio amylolyticus]
MRKIKVLVVDDSPVFRALLSQIINSDDELEVIAAAEDPYEARQMIKEFNPDVITLDIEMPKMNGVQFLRNLMRLRPMPVVMISTLTQHGAEATLEALETGAVDYFPKPAVEATGEIVEYKTEINKKIRMAAKANVQTANTAEVAPEIDPCSKQTEIELIAIGASTGGTEAVKNVMAALPAGLPPIIITQHISAMFTRSFAKRLDDASDVEVKELTASKAPLINGCAYVAPGDKHITVFRRGSHLFCQLDDSPPMSRHKPSVDVMYHSVAEVVGDKAIGVLLTGMGSDGAEGMLNMKNKGAITLAQDEKSSVVWGMPKVAYEIGAVKKLVSLSQVPKQLYNYIYK